MSVEFPSFMHEHDIANRKTGNHIYTYIHTQKQPHTHTQEADSGHPRPGGHVTPGSAGKQHIKAGLQLTPASHPRLGSFFLS